MMNSGRGSQDRRNTAPAGRLRAAASGRLRAAASGGLHALGASEPHPAEDGADGADDGLDRTVVEDVERLLDEIERLRERDRDDVIDLRPDSTDEVEGALYYRFDVLEIADNKPDHYVERTAEGVQEQLPVLLDPVKYVTGYRLNTTEVPDNRGDRLDDRGNQDSVQERPGLLDETKNCLDDIAEGLEVFVR